jgi:hypothetical protein
MIADFLTFSLGALFAVLMALNVALTIAQLAGFHKITVGIQSFASRFLWAMRLGAVGDATHHRAR